MCGIIAISSNIGRQYELDDALWSIRHRGPDGKGSFKSEKGDCHLGHVRLSIVDLTTAGRQPMIDSSGRFVISYNGEIYNHTSLKRELQADYGPINWQSDTDTEVVLEGFAREGLSFLDKLNGIFSIAIYDSTTRKLLVVRDPIGIKPLYITVQNRAVYFSSEIKAILKLPEIKATVRKQSLADVLTFMYVPEPHTMYEEISKVEPGSYLVYFEGREIESGRLFSHLTDPILFDSDEDLAACFKATFSAAVARQVLADVPVSLFLSGGLDSSAIAYEVINNGGLVKDAYTISFGACDVRNDHQSDDLFYAKLIAEKFGIKLNVINAKSDFISLLPELSHYMEDGLADPAAINTYLICKGARDNGIKVMLSGQGADEYLGGYRRYLAETMYRRLPPLALKVLSSIGGLLPSSIPGKFNGQFRRLKRFAYTAGLSGSDRLLSLYMWDNPDTIEQLFQDSSDIFIGKDHLDLFMQSDDIDTISAMMLVDQKYDLTSLNLSYTDKMSMMAGVEARVPFLDLEMVRLMNSIPLSMKIRGTTQKYLLKKTMMPYLPREVIFRQKAGFGLPIRSWLKTQSAFAEQYLNRNRIERQGIFNPVMVRRLCNEQFSGARDHSYTMFAMLSLQIWLDSA